MLSPVLFVATFVCLLFAVSTDSENNKHRDYPRSCKELFELGFDSDYYVIKPKFSPKPFIVHCDMINSGGGWTEILKRSNSNQSFAKLYNEYVVGFGHLAKNFWLGLEKMYQLTGFESTELLFEIVTPKGVSFEFFYSSFSLGSNRTGYDVKLLGSCSRGTGDGFYTSGGMKFTTTDVDRDENPDANCADTSQGGWWYNKCGLTQLTGVYFDDYATKIWNAKYIDWKPWSVPWHQIKSVRMMVRPRTGTNGDVLFPRREQWSKKDLCPKI